MNKYQEALLELGKYTVVLSWSKNQTCSIAELNEFKLLQELVDKETPKEKTWKANGKGKIIDCCPICKNQIKAFDRYCKNCGQALKWSEE